MKAEVTVEKPGLLSSVQDTGRWNYLSYGVPVSGVMDSDAAKLANLLLKNSLKAAVLEITLLGPELTFSSSTAIALTGAHLSPELNFHPISNNKVYSIKPGDRLGFGKRTTGCRTYLGIAKGFKTPKVLQSRSWFSGVTEVSRLERGMKLPYTESSEVFHETHSGIRDLSYLEKEYIEALPGPEFDMLSSKQRTQITDNRFQLSPKTNRMGIELIPRIANKIESILTGPVLPGSVQLTPDGNLIVLMRDCQTTGGYPRVLQLTEKGINSLSQKNVGQQVSFQLL